MAYDAGGAAWLTLNSTMEATIIAAKIA